MARAKQQPDPAPEVVDTEPAPDGCIWMYRADERTPVHVESGSVEIMEAAGWSTSVATDSED